jgi:ATP-dependent DNA helicase PIF1
MADDAIQYYSHPEQSPIQEPHIDAVECQQAVGGGGNNTQPIDPSLEQLKDLILVKEKSVLLLSFGGAGKSYLIRQLVDFIKQKIPTFVVNVTATTGVAAVNVKGQTLHRFFGVGLARESADVLINKIRYTRKDVVKRLIETDLLIIDEVSMLSKEFWEKLDTISKAIRKNFLPFGGLRLLISGDFLQLPPVNGEWVFESDEWHKINFIPMFLTEPKRFTDKSYFHMLLRIREGIVSQLDIQKLRARVVAYEDYIKALKAMDPEAREQMIKPTKIYPHRAKAEEENVEELDKLPGVMVLYLAKDSFESCNPKLKVAQYSEVFEGLAPKEVKLKVGAQVMLTFNLSIDSGLCNGSRGVVVKLNQDSALVKFLADPENPVLIDPQCWSFEDATVNITRRQIPLALAWAQTIHKSQGSTLDFCVADVGPDVFAAGQAYVALSRARNWDSLLLKNFVPKAIKANQKALEYVHKLEEQV